MKPTLFMPSKLSLVLLSGFKMTLFSRLSFLVHDAIVYSFSLGKVLCSL